MTGNGADGGNDRQGTPVPGSQFGKGVQGFLVGCAFGAQPAERVPRLAVPRVAQMSASFLLGDRGSRL